jgi:hypothetical protein
VNNDKPCACGCGASLRRKRYGALYFSNACRTRAHRARALRAAQIARDASHNRYTTSADAFWTGYRQIRRPDFRTDWPRP